MTATRTSEEASERKRLTIPKVDSSVIEWWNAQHDAGLSVRLLIRSEIERNGMSDVAYRPVTQQPKRGRPAGSGVESGDDALQDSGPEEHEADLPRIPAPAEVRAPEPISAAAMSPIDAIMNG